MNKFVFLLAAAALFISNCSEQPKRTQRAGTLEITAVGTEYRLWQYRDASITGWGVRVHVVNTTDQAVSENIKPASLQIMDDAGKRYSLPDNFSKICTMINLGQLSSQRLGGDLLFFNTGTALRIRDTNSTVGTLVGVRDKSMSKFNLELQLSPKKSVTLVFVFDSPKESKPQTLNWPNAKPIDLR